MIKGRLDELNGTQGNNAVSQIGGVSGVCEPDANAETWVKGFFDRTMQGVSTREL